MLKEKLNKFLKGDGNSKKQIENLVFFLMILVVTVVAINFIWKDDQTKSEHSEENSSKTLASHSMENNIVEQNNLETRLENILTNISGVGKVKVLLTYNETEELIPVYNQKDKTSTTNEKDAGGGTRQIEEKDISKEVVYQEDKVITQKKISPQIEGAIITAQGANNAVIKSNIIQAVEAATGLATHKIQVFEKQD